MNTAYRRSGVSNSNGLTATAATVSTKKDNIVQLSTHFSFLNNIYFFFLFFSFLNLSGDFPWQLTEFIIGVFLQVLGLPFVAVAQVSLFSKVTSEKTQGKKQQQTIMSRLKK